MFKVIFSIIIFSKFLFASIGTVTSLEGKATIQREGKNIIALAGIEIEKKDIVSTELNSKLKITLIDNTIITIGKESTLNIEEYIFDNIKAQPRNFEADEPGDVVQYIEAHDNLTLYDVIAQSIKKDPDLYDEEIHLSFNFTGSYCLLNCFRNHR